MQKDARDSVRAKVLWLLAMAPAAVVVALSGGAQAHRFDASWIHMSALVGFCGALVGVPAGLVFVGLHAIRASPRRTRLCMFALLVNSAAFSLLLLAASLAFVSNSEAAIFLVFAVIPAAMAATLAWRLDSSSTSGARTRVRAADRERRE